MRTKKDMVTDFVSCVLELVVTDDFLLHGNSDYIRAIGLSSAKEFRQCTLLVLFKGTRLI